MSIETLLHEEIENEVRELEKIEVGSEKYKTAVNGIAQLYDRAIEMKKSDAELEAKRYQHEVDSELRADQMKQDHKNEIVKNCISVAGIVIPAALTVWGTFKSIEFEKEGTITTIMGRGFIQKLLPKN